MKKAVEKISLIGANRIYIVVCLLLALIITFRIYPFIGLADGFSRWDMAIEIYQNGHIIKDTLLSPVLPYLKAITYALTNSYALFTYIQCALFYISIGILAKTLGGGETLRRTSIPLWFIAASFILCIPTVYIFPALLTDSAAVFILISLIIWLFQKQYNRYLIIIGEIILISLCIGIRINSFVLFGIIGFASFILWIRKKEKRYGVIIFTILIGCLLGVFVPKLLYPNSYNASTLGMIWEMTGIVHDTNDPFLKQELGKYGNIEEAVNRYGEPFLNSIVWDYDPPFSAYDIAGKYAKNITVLYIRTAFKNPKEFIYNKWQFISRSLGINQPLISASRGIHSVDNITMSYGSVKTDLQETTRNNFIEFTDQMKGISLRPIVLIILCLTLILLAYKIHAIKDFQKYLFLLGIAVAYYTSFLINTQAYEFRYYAPSFYLMFVILVCIIIKIIAKLIEKWIIRKQSNKETCRCRKSRAIMK